MTCTNNWYISGEVARWFWTALGFALCACVAVTAAFVAVVAVKQ